MSMTSSRASRARVATAVAVLAVTTGSATSAAGGPGPLATTKSDMVYVLMAHPDDETSGWQLIDDFADSYVVFVTLTNGERSAACLTAEESRTYRYDDKEQRTLRGEPGVGPYRYEGPGSPVGQVDEGERRPFGDPWQGIDHPACGQAKVASWHWFLDGVSAFTPGLPDFGISTSPGGDPWAHESLRTHCWHPESGTGNGRGQHEKAAGSRATLGCVDIWTHPDGARLAFDLGDAGWPDGDPAYRDPDPMGPDEVVTALEVVRARRSSWGIPRLPESAMIAAAAGCAPKGPVDAAHSDHEAVQEALYHHDFRAGPQYGIICDGVTNHYGSLADKRFLESPGPVQAPDALTWWRLNETAPNPSAPGRVIKVGPMARDYGWIAEGSNGTWDFPFHVMWKRFG